MDMNMGFNNSKKETMQFNTRKTPLNTNLSQSKAFTSKILLENNITKTHSPYFYHVTTFKNVPSIKKTGLSPQHGGNGGACDVINHDTFRNNSKGFVHGSPDAKSARFYIDLFEVSSENTLQWSIIKRPQDLKDCAIVLRFRNDTLETSWLKDPSDSVAFKTNKTVEASDIEALTTEGWVPIFALKEVSKALVKPSQKK